MLIEHLDEFTAISYHGHLVTLFFGKDMAWRQSRDKDFWHWLARKTLIDQ